MKEKGVWNSRVRLEIDLEAVAANLSAIRERVKPRSVMAVLKADAYGLDMRRIAPCVLEAGAERIAVAEIREARALRALGGRFKRLPVQILSALLPHELEEAVALDVTCPLSDEAIARALSREALRQNKRARAHVKVDTGMGRLGFPVETAERTIRRLLRLPGIEIEGLMTHFASANRPEDPATARQAERFHDLRRALSDVPFRWIHLANSDAINNFPTLEADLVRTGINLYGVFDLEGRRGLRLLPSLSLRTRLASVKRLPAGHAIGYGGTHVLSKATLVGALPAGYADGLPLALSNRGHVLIRGKRCPVIGRVSMDYTTVDLSKAPKARLGDEVLLIGRSGGESITVEDWARIKGTHPYEIICSFGKRVERVHV